MRTLIVAGVLMAAAAGVAAAQSVTITAAPSTAPKGYDEVHYSRAGLSGQEIRVWGAMMLDPDCSPHGSMATQIVEAPRHGRAAVSDEPFYPSFTPPNPRAACDTKKAPGKQVFYTSEPGFHGSDMIVVQNATSEGMVRKIIIDIDVR